MQSHKNISFRIVEKNAAPKERSADSCYEKHWGVQNGSL